MQEFFDKANLLWGAVIAVLTWIFGEYWFVFFLFLCAQCDRLHIRVCKIKGNPNAGPARKGRAAF